MTDDIYAPKPPATSQPTPPAPPQVYQPAPPAYAPQPQQVYVTPQPVYTGHPPAPAKSLGAAYVLWFFLGVLGIHQFYLGKTGRGLLYLFTGGLLLVGVFIDLFTLPSQVRQVNAQRAVGIR